MGAGDPKLTVLRPDEPPALFPFLRILFRGLGLPFLRMLFRGLELPSCCWSLPWLLLGGKTKRRTMLSLLTPPRRPRRSPSTGPLGWDGG